LSGEAEYEESHSNTVDEFPAVEADVELAFEMWIRIPYQDEEIIEVISGTSLSSLFTSLVIYPLTRSTCFQTIA
jgi:hypothetical protein